MVTVSKKSKMKACFPLPAWNFKYPEGTLMMALMATDEGEAMGERSESSELPFGSHEPCLGGRFGAPDPEHKVQVSRPTVWATPFLVVRSTSAIRAGANRPSVANDSIRVTQSTFIDREYCQNEWPSRRFGLPSHVPHTAQARRPLITSLPGLVTLLRRWLMPATG